MIKKFNLYMPQFHEYRQIHMYLPNDYFLTQKKYSVLYMFDGHNLFLDEDATYGTSWDLGNQIENRNLDILVVGQECSHINNQRLNEYSPYPFADEYIKASFEGQGNKTLDFFIHTLKPYIDQHYRTFSDRAHTWIGGSSCGGTMALYSLMNYPNTFSKSLVISPYLQPFYSYLLLDASKIKYVYPSKIYMSWGGLEHDEKHEFVLETKMCTEISNALIQHGIKVFFNVKLEGEHNERSWREEVPDFLSFLSEK